VTAHLNVRSSIPCEKLALAPWPPSMEAVRQALTGAFRRGVRALDRSGRAGTSGCVAVSADAVRESRWRTMQESSHQNRVQPRRLPEDAPNILIVLLDGAGPAPPDPYDFDETLPGPWDWDVKRLVRAHRH
jgi:hypothetical protein